MRTQFKRLNLKVKHLKYSKMKIQVVEIDGALKLRVLNSLGNVAYEGNVDSETVADLEWALSEIVRYNKQRKNK